MKVQFTGQPIMHVGVGLAGCVYVIVLVCEVSCWVVGHRCLELFVVPLPQGRTASFWCAGGGVGNG